MSTLLERKIPVPKHYSYNIYDSLVSTILVFVCVIAFKPSFISDISYQDQIIVASIISLVVAIVTIGKCIVVAKMEQSGKWTFKTDLITLFIVLFTISVLLVALSPLVLNTWLKLPLSVDTEDAMITFGFTHLIGFLLFFVSISAKYVIHGLPDQSLAIRNLDTLEEIKEENKIESSEITIEGKNQGERLVILKENLISISTNGHYIDIFLFDPEKAQSTKVVFRNSIISVTDSLKEHEEFIQCHRSHLINIEHIENLSGSSKKMEVKLKSLDLKVPVSRTKAAYLAELLENQGS